MLVKYDDFMVLAIRLTAYCPRCNTDKLLSAQFDRIFDQNINQHDGPQKRLVKIVTIERMLAVFVAVFP